MKTVYIVLNWMEQYNSDDVVRIELPDSVDEGAIVERIEYIVNTHIEDEEWEDLSTLEAIERAFDDLGYKWEFVRYGGTVYLKA